MSNPQSNGLAEIKNPTTRVHKMITDFIDKGTLFLPPNFSPENALKSAWLTLQEVKDRENRPVLQHCTQESIVNALLDMVVQGLNPAKKQCYFIAYGAQLSCQRSYFGDMMLAERVRPGIEVFANVVYEGDEFEYSMVRGRTIVTKHVQKLENKKLDKIIAAYCGILDENGNELGTEIMTWAQIQKSWTKSKTYKPGATTGTHGEFPDQMAMRTVIRRRCKPIINSSSDALLMASIQRQELDAAENEMDEEVAENAHAEALSVEPPIDAEFTVENGASDQPELVGASSGGGPGF